MDEGVLFNNNKPKTEGDGTPPETPTQPMAGEVPVAESASQTPNGETPVQSEAPVSEAQVPVASASVDPSVPAEETPQEVTEAVEEPAPQSGFGGNGLLKKILIGVGIVLLIGILIFLFLPKQQQAKNVKLTWWGLWEDDRVMQSIISDFERENPNIQVEYIKQVPKQYRDRLLTRMENGTGPDIFRFHNSWLPMMQKVLTPLAAETITPSDFQKTYYPVMQKDLVSNGAIYGIPLGTDSLALFVNTELLKSAGVEPPRDWDEFLKAARKLTVKDENDEIETSGAGLGTAGNVTHFPDILSVLFAQQGVDIEDLPNSVDAEIDSLEFYTGFANGQQNTWNGTLDDSLIAFSRGELAMYFGYSWDVFAIRTLNKSLPFTIYAMPALYGKNMTVASYWAEGVSSQSPNKKEALLFMKHLVKKETAQKFYEAAAKERGFGEPPARKDLAESIQDEPLVAPFVNQMDNATSSYFMSDTYDGDTGMNSVLNNYLRDAVNAIVIDHTSEDTAVGKLNTAISQILKKYEL